MRNKVMYVVVSMLVVLGLLLGGFGCAKEAPPTTPTTPATPTTPTTPAAPTAPEVTHWKMQVQVLEVTPFGPYKYSYHAVWSAGWRDWIEKVTNGRLTVEMIPPQAAFPDEESLTAVGTGVVDCAMEDPGTWAGTMPEMYVAGGLPLSWMSVGEWYDAWYRYGMLEKIAPLYEEFNIVFIPALSMEYMDIFSTFPMPHPSSVEGHKIRAFGQWLKYIGLLGAVPVSLPYSDVYMALKLGTIEGAWTGAQSLDTIKIGEVCNNFVTNPNGTLNCLLINSDAFKALPEDIHETIKEETPYHFIAGGLLLLEQQGYTLARGKGKYGLTLWTWSDEEIAKIRKEVVEKLWPEYAAKSAMGPELMEMVKKQLKDHGKL